MTKENPNPRKSRRVPKRPKLTKTRKPPLEVILELYDAFLRESQYTKIAEVLEIDVQTLMGWLQRYQEFRTARKMAEERRGNREGLADYIVGHLSPEARECYDKLQFWEGKEDMEEKIRYMLRDRPKRVRQELYLHALVRSNFDPSTALRMSGVSRVQVDDWVTYDPEFKALVKEIHWHKKNFFEKALLDLVEERHPGAVIFVNKTVNADRGYNERIDVHHSGSVGGGGVDVDDLDLPLDIRKAIYQAVQRKKQASAQASAQPIMDVQTVKQIGPARELETVGA